LIQLTPQMRILVAIEPVDFRKGIDGLARLCKDRRQADPYSGCVFVFRRGRLRAREQLLSRQKGNQPLAHAGVVGLPLLVGIGSDVVRHGQHRAAGNPRFLAGGNPPVSSRFSAAAKLTSRFAPSIVRVMVMGTATV